jgi:hypothetical protein
MSAVFLGLDRTMQALARNYLSSSFSLGGH